MRRRCLSLLITLATVAATLGAGTATATDAPIGHLGDTLRVVNDAQGIVADVTVVSVEQSEVPPGFGNPPKWPREEVWKARVVIQAVKVPHPHSMAATFVFNGVTPTGDAYQPRNSDATDALQYALLNAPQGSTVTGYVFWDCYRDLVNHVVLTDRQTGFHLAQWDL